MADSEMKCLKCFVEVSLETSHASGRNALRRVCLDCSNTDRWLQRCKKTKGKSNETPKEKELRENAEKVSASLGKMTAEEKAEWYKKQAAERQAEGPRRRTFETAVGTLTEERTRHQKSEDVDKWWRFKDWAAREILVTGCKHTDVKRLWDLELQKPGAITKVQRGETLLKDWAGQEDRLGSSHSVSAGMKQRMDLHRSEDLSRFQDQSSSRLERGESLLEADRLLNHSNNTNQESQLLRVQEDMEEAAKVRKEQEQRLYEEAEKAEEQRKARQQKPVKLNSASLEHLQFEQSIERSVTSMDSYLRKLKNSFSGLVAEVKEAGVEGCPNGKAELAEKQEKFKQLAENMECFIRQKEHWQAEKDKSPPEELENAAQHWNQLYMDVCRQVKNLATAERATCLKTFMAQTRKWVSEFKKRNGKLAGKKAAASAKAAAVAAGSKQPISSGPPSGTDTQMGADLLKSVTGAKAAGQDMGEVFNLSSPCFNIMDWLCGKHPNSCLKIMAAQTKSLRDEWLAMPYYGQQKEWVQELWKKDKKKVEVSLALVAKPALAGKIDRAWTGLLGTSAAAECLDITTDADLQEVFQPCYWSFGKGMSKLFYSTDYGLTELKMVLEGSAFFMGRAIFPSELESGLGAFCEKLRGMTAEAWIDECETSGWLTCAVAGEVVGIPAGHAYIQVCEQETHGVRILKGCRRGLKYTVQLLDARVKEWPDLAGQRTGRLHTWLKSV
ncbi:unnamed protein product [Symbiodinium natans]|uniref:Uncharacterized protein n=1 Tax=Symbiodinium natans TaxID=878477 RepID=A0A812T6Q3_9DINO|nr:unnamed protein product [Symbiodinium natans]